MGMPKHACPLSGGGGTGQVSPTGSEDVWQANSIAWLSNFQIHKAVIASQTQLYGTGLDDNHTRRFVDYRRQGVTRHSHLLNICNDFARSEYHALGHQSPQHVTDSVSAIIGALHCGIASSIIFSDNAHWRCIHFDPVRMKKLCIDPYGNGKPGFSFNQDLKLALQNVLAEYCPGWAVEETTLIMQHRSDEHSCGVWTIWMADEWMRFVEAGLPAPGFEQWLSEKLQTPHPMGRRPRQDIMRTYYGRMISETDDMDPVATRPLFRRAYFSNLYAHWLSRTENAGGISMHAIARDLPLARQSPDNDLIDLLGDDASTSCISKIAPMGPKGCDPRMRSHRPHTQTTCMDGRQLRADTKPNLGVLICTPTF